MRVWPGNPYPQGATWDGEGTNFSLFSENATAVDLCLFDHPGDAVESARIPIRERTDLNWHVYLPDVRPGQLYGYRVHGPFAPDEGHRFNAHKLLLDPYAKAVTGAIQWSDSLFGYRIGDSATDLSFSEDDSAAGMPKCVVIESAFSWGDDRSPCVPWNRTVIYECHVKGLTMLHPDIAESVRGTYLGLATDPIVDHLLSLGVTAVELLPVHHFVADRHLVERGLTNYWGYNSIGFFAPDVRYATRGGDQVSEFKSMVKRLHRAGIEVILDVVYNHTGEGNELGPTLCLRGVDNASYYRTNPENRRYYVDFTGCGNSLNMVHPRTMQLIMDSLRYWVLEMHVDGFRFDLAPALARELYEVNRLGTFFDIIQQDPVLSQVKLIAEPWDLGPGGYQVGNFPSGWAEWNGKYRDAVRRFWRGDRDVVAELASRLSGSSDLYAASDRHPYASVNFVTCHDGFTLHDLVSYERKHNDANGEESRDGTDDNLSRNWGHEGAGRVPTDHPHARAHEAQLHGDAAPFARGADALAGGRVRTHAVWQQQRLLPGQRDELGGLDCSTSERRELLRVHASQGAARVSGMANPVLRRRKFFRGPPGRWGRGQGRHLARRRWARRWSEDDWRGPGRSGARHAHQWRRHPTSSTNAGGRSQGDTLLLLLNGGARSHDFTLPPALGLRRRGARSSTRRDTGTSRAARTPSVALAATFPHSPAVCEHMRLCRSPCGPRRRDP